MSHLFSQVNGVDVTVSRGCHSLCHTYYQAPNGMRLRNNGGERGRGLGWKIDTRAHGGQVLAAGSIVAGRSYRVLAVGTHRARIGHRWPRSAGFGRTHSGDPETS